MQICDILEAILDFCGHLVTLEQKVNKKQISGIFQ